MSDVPAVLPTEPGRYVLARVLRLGDELRRLRLHADGDWRTDRGCIDVSEFEITDWTEIDYKQPTTEQETSKP